MKEFLITDLIIPFSPAEIEGIVRHHYPNMPTKIIALATGRTEAAIYRMAGRMDLKKSEEFRQYLLNIEAERLRKVGVKTRFPKNHTPANKGKSMTSEQYRKCSKTMFKKGHKPHNTKYNGHISIREDKTGRKYAYVRVKLGVYKLLHRYIWEMHNGPIPEGYIVVFRNDDTMNCTLENLELITKEENLNRNFHNRYPSEIKDIIRLKGALNRQIRKKETA